MTVKFSKHNLTPREREVVELAGKRLGDKEIAQALGLSPRTVQNHLHRAYEKLGVSHRLQAAQRLSDFHSGQLQPLSPHQDTASDGESLPTHGMAPEAEREGAGPASWLRRWRRPPKLRGSLLWLILIWALVWLMVLAVGAALANLLLEAMHRLQVK